MVKSEDMGGSLESGSTDSVLENSIRCYDSEF